MGCGGYPSGDRSHGNVDLAIAVLCGVILSALIFSWENALRIRARKMVDEHGIKHYQIYAPLLCFYNFIPDQVYCKE